LTVETRYFRSDTESVNGLDTEKLRTSQSGVSGYKEKTYTDVEEIFQAVYGKLHGFRRTRLMG